MASGPTIDKLLSGATLDLAPDVSHLGALNRYGAAKVALTGHLFLFTDSGKLARMATAVVYIDEAGTPEPHREPLSAASGETPLFALAAVALPLVNWRTCDRAFFRLKKQFFPDMMGRAGKRDEEVEVKGRDLTSPRQKTSARRQEFNRRALRFMDQCGARAFGATFLKPPSGTHSSRSIYGNALQILVERVSLFVAEHPAYTNAILICDSRMKGAGRCLETSPPVLDDWRRSFLGNTADATTPSVAPDLGLED